MINELLANLKKLPANHRVLVEQAWDGVTDPTFPDHLIQAGELVAALGDQPAPAIIRVRVNEKDGLNIRTKPISGKIVEAFPNGTEVSVFETKTAEGWYQIASGTYKNMYISADYVVRV